MAGKRQPQKEDTRQLEAFESYYAMGDKRSYRNLAQQYNVSVTTINKWAKKFNWLERIEQRNLVVAKKMESKAIQTVVDMKVKYRQSIQYMFAEMLKEMQKGEKGTFPRIETMADFEKLIKIDMLLMGENTEKVEIEDKRQPGTPIDEILAGDEDARNAVRELFIRLRNAARSGDGTS